MKKWQAVRRVLSFVRPWRLRYFFGLTLYSGQGYLSSLMYSGILALMTQSILSGDAGTLVEHGLISVAMVVGCFVLLALGIYLMVLVQLRAGRALKKAVFESFVETNIEAGAGAGQGIAAINTEADQALELLDNTMAQFYGCLLNIVLSSATIFLCDWRLGIVSILVGLFAMVVQMRFTKPLEKISHSQLDTNAQMLTAMSGILTGAVSIRAFDLQENVTAAFEKENLKALLLAYRAARINSLQAMLKQVQSWLSLAGVLGFGAYLVATGSLSFPVLMMVPSLCTSLAFGMSRFGEGWAMMQGPIAAAMRVGERIAHCEAVKAVDAKRESVPYQGESVLRVEGLDFSYLEAEALALSQLSFSVAPRRLMAVVGESGCGKSTLLRVLSGFYERGEQPIFLANHQLGVVPVQDWRAHFALVDQSCKLFDMSIAQNIALGKAGATQEEIIAAARAAGAHAFISELPDGYDTPCGERGMALSGGQKQRIAIARALCRNAPVLVLDEATAALDAQSEQAILQTVSALRQRCTVLMVTHQLSQAAMADEILVMKQGRIVERGTAQELLQQEGEYLRLYQRQQKEEA